MKIILSINWLTEYTTIILQLLDWYTFDKVNTNKELAKFYFGTTRIIFTMYNFLQVKLVVIRRLVILNRWICFRSCTTISRAHPIITYYVHPITEVYTNIQLVWQLRLTLKLQKSSLPIINPYTNHLKGIE